jgi:hypothetical protein
MKFSPKSLKLTQLEQKSQEFAKLMRVNLRFSKTQETRSMQQFTSTAS